ncbi:hypothetical protein [Pseudoxanthomonas sp. UTMC 1351]|uniref:hypothetical protein n=1 Tax=Pseudoxanthomonas sp. UTMC 1351 TaxID=2695853 RepID=UPI0034CEC9EA
MAAYMHAVAKNPGEYQLTGNNCVNFVRQVLLRGGVQSSSAIQPKPFFKDLPGKP